MILIGRGMYQVSGSMMGNGGWPEAGKVAHLLQNELSWCFLKRLPRLDEFDW